jgi:hypothetical protein
MGSRKAPHIQQGVLGLREKFTTLTALHFIGIVFSGLLASKSASYQQREPVFGRLHC